MFENSPRFREIATTAATAVALTLPVASEIQASALMDTPFEEMVLALDALAKSDVIGATYTPTTVSGYLTVDESDVIEVEVRGEKVRTHRALFRNNESDPIELAQSILIDIDTELRVIKDMLGSGPIAADQRVYFDPTFHQVGDQVVLRSSDMCIDMVKAIYADSE